MKKTIKNKKHLKALGSQTVIQYKNEKKFKKISTTMNETAIAECKNKQKLNKKKKEIEMFFYCGRVS